MGRYLVTGGAGFIGSHLVRTLVTNGEKVRVLDNCHTGHRENLRDVNDEIEFIEGDLTDYEMVKRAAREVDVIFHQAAVPSVPKSIKNPLLSNDVNVTGTLKLLVAAVECGVRRVIYAASSSAYGSGAAIPKIEAMQAAPLSPYAVSKYTGELYCRVFHRIYGLETLSLRYFNVFGPCQDPSSEYAAVIPRFITSMLKDNSPVIFGDGTQSRDFTYIDNVVHANLLAAQAPHLCGETVNIGCGEQTAINALVTKINSFLGKEIEPVYRPERLGDVRHSLASIGRALEVIGYKPIVPFDEGLKRTVTWYQERYAHQILKSPLSGGRA